MVFQFRAVSPNTAASARAYDAPAGMQPLLASRERAPFGILFFPSCLALFYFSVFFLKAALSSFLFIVNTFFDSRRYGGGAIPKERRLKNLRSLFFCKILRTPSGCFFLPATLRNRLDALRGFFLLLHRPQRLHGDRAGMINRLPLHLFEQRDQRDGQIGKHKERE